MADEEQTETAEEAETEAADEAKDESEVEETSDKSPIDLANDAAERMEKANKERAALQKKDEKILAEMKLQGKSTAGGAPVEKAEETPQEYKDRIMRGEL